MILIRVELPYLCAGVVAKGDQIRRAAPILAWSVGMSPMDLAAWVMEKGGRVSVVERFREAAAGRQE